MPTFGDFTQFFGGQLFGKTWFPQVDLTGKTIIVTGSNTGLGLDCAKHLYSFSSVQGLHLMTNRLQRAPEAIESYSCLPQFRKGRGSEEEYLGIEYR